MRRVLGSVLAVILLVGATAAAGPTDAVATENIRRILQDNGDGSFNCGLSCECASMTNCCHDCYP